MGGHTVVGAVISQGQRQSNKSTISRTKTAGSMQVLGRGDRGWAATELCLDKTAPGPGVRQIVVMVAAGWLPHAGLGKLPVG